MANLSSNSLPAAILLPITLALTTFIACGGASNQSQLIREPQRLAAGQVASAPNGIAFPDKYKNWPVLAVHQRADEKTISVVVSNLAATRAARKRQTNPWPNGSIIGHLVFEQAAIGNIDNAIRAGDFIRAEFMFKDVERYADNDSGWGWARWDGQDLEPFGRDDSEADCIKCHTSVSGNDWLFSRPVTLP